MASKGDGIFNRGKVWRLDCYINDIRLNKKARPENKLEIVLMVGV
jgi:hypothetical protein